MAAPRTNQAATPMDPLATSPCFDSIEAAHQALAPVMEAIAGVGGPECEVVLHNLTTGDLEHSVYAIINGHVSGRSVGGPSTNLGAEVLRDESKDHNAFGYRSRTSDGRKLISSSVYYRNSQGKIIAALCINRDLSSLHSAMAALTNMTPADSGWESQRPQELIAPDVTTVLDDMISEAVQTVGKPTATMSKADRIEVLRLLDNRGAFHIKRAADKVATRLGVSRVTAYGYLDEVRKS